MQAIAPGCFFDVCVSTGFFLDANHGCNNECLWMTSVLAVSLTHFPLGCAFGFLRQTVLEIALFSLGDVRRKLFVLAIVSEGMRDGGMAIREKLMDGLLYFLLWRPVHNFIGGM